MGYADDCGFEGDKLWKMQQRFDEDRNKGQNGTVQVLELFRNKINMHMLHAFVESKARGCVQCVR